MGFNSPLYYNTLMNRLSKLMGALTVGAAIFFSGCYPLDPLNYEDLDAVVTVKSDPNFDFSDPNIKTYYLADTIIDLSEPGNSPAPVVDRQKVIQDIIKNMDMLGYTRLTGVDSLVANQADYLMLLSVNRSNNYYYSYWYSWGGWYGWGWYGYYPCCYYPPTSTISNVRTGALIVQLMDVKRLGQIDEQHLPEVWVGVVQGLYEGSAQSLNQRSSRGIDQMFNQSPYLKR